MYASHELGKQGENYACQYLKTKGYQIIQRNFSCKQGEIDIIAKDKEEYVFIEVKTRHNFHYGMLPNIIYIYISWKMYIFVLISSKL